MNGLGHALVHQLRSLGLGGEKAIPISLDVHCENGIDDVMEYECLGPL